MARISFPVTTFQNLEGQPLSFGYLLIKISQDVRTPDPGQLGEQSVSRINLDVNGVMIGSPTFWQNNVLLPTGSVYILNSYTQQGQNVLYNNSVTV